MHPTRRAFVLFLLGVVAFTIYGSLVPFEYRPRPWDETAPTFARMMRDRLVFESRSDALANLLLGVPLGFGLLGLAFAEKPPNRPREMLVGLLLLPVCVLFAAGVEFAQLYFPLRTCAGSDVLCQAVGAAIGMAVWVMAGRTIVGTVRDFWTGTGSASRALFAYVLLLAFIQLLPLDLNASPRTAAKKRTREVSYVPFGELLDAPPGHEWEQVAKLVKLFGLFLPVGLLAARLPGRFWVEMPFLRGVAVAVGAAAVLEAIQLPIESRMPSATDVVVGAGGAVIGWVFGRARRPAFPGGNLIGYMVFWVLMLAVIWGPLPFPPLIRTPPASFDWMPGLPLESGNPLFALEDMLTKLVLFGLGGAMVGAVDAKISVRTRAAIGGVIGLAASGAIEALQTVFGSHTPSITDVLLGGLGAIAGAWIAGRMGRW